MQYVNIFVYEDFYHFSSGHFILYLMNESISFFKKIFLALDAGLGMRTSLKRLVYGRGDWKVSLNME